jgi:Ulp1 family protease
MLEEKNWMNDKIINFCLELFRFKYKQILILDSFFMEIIKKRRNQKVFKTILKKKIFNNKRIILPVNRKNSHWYFVYICESKIYLIDSMNNNGGDKELILNWAKKTIKMEGINRDLEWDKNDTPDQYKQETSWSCGLWVLCGIHFICKNKSWKIVTEQIIDKFRMDMIKDVKLILLLKRNKTEKPKTIKRKKDFEENKVIRKRIK